MIRSFSPVELTSPERRERIKRRCGRIGALGLLGFLKDLSGFYAPFRHAEWLFLICLAWYVPIGIGLLEGFGYWEKTDTADSDGHPTTWIESGYSLNPIESVLSSLVLFQPIVFTRSVLQNVGGFAALRRYKDDSRPSPPYDSDVDYRPPFEGEWTVVNGSPDPAYSHSSSLPQQRYAYDFVITDERGRTHDGGTGPEAHYCFKKPILAPAEGTVVETADGHRDYHRTDGWRDPLQYRLHGNYVILKHSENEYSVLSHLQQGSTCVKEGDHVAQGEQVGRCGNSGNSTEPHLHYQLQDRPSRYLTVGIPIEFSDTITRSPNEDGTYHDQTAVHCGELVSADRSSRV